MFVAILALAASAFLAGGDTTPAAPAATVTVAPQGGVTFTPITRTWEMR